MQSFPFRYWLALFPDINKPIGGVKQMHRLGESLIALGREASLIQSSASFKPTWFDSSLSAVSLDDWRQRTDFSKDRDIVVLPETFLPKIVSLHPDTRTVIFNQNGSYTFGLPGRDEPYAPEDVIRAYSSSKINHVFCVSDYDYELLSYLPSCQNSALSLSKIVNPIDPCFLQPVHGKRRIISFMPRKNKHEYEKIIALIKAQDWSKGYKFVPIVNCSQDQVAEIMRQSILFLSFGHPEGFGLPVAEAMACGCAVIGFSGLGGRELFEIGSSYGTAYEVPFGDWVSFLQCTKSLLLSLDNNAASVLSNIQAAAKIIRSKYTHSEMVNSLSEGLKLFEHN